jgi:3-dehydroquinate synthase II
LEKLVWIRTDKNPNQDQRKKMVTTALEKNFTNILVAEADIPVFEKLGKFDMIKIQDEKLILDGHTVEYIVIKDNSDQDSAMAMADKVEYVVVSAIDWKIIPIENLIAAFQNSKSKLLVEVGTASEAKVNFETLEVGVDGVVLNTSDVKEVFELHRVMEQFQSEQLPLVDATITKIQAVGTGDRVCIDTCSMLKIGEGMLIGSQSNGLMLVHSESVPGEYVATRPFRVNAGPVHAYILAIGNKTKYLSDLKAGDEVLAVDQTGATRNVVIGRVKIENRPLLMVEVVYENVKYNIILQNAETIRLISNGKPVSVVELKEGDTIQMWVSNGASARHFGMKVNESITEK